MQLTPAPIEALVKSGKLKAHQNTQRQEISNATKVAIARTAVSLCSSQFRKDLKETFLFLMKQLAELKGAFSKTAPVSGFEALGGSSSGMEARFDQEPTLHNISTYVCSRWVLL